MLTVLTQKPAFLSGNWDKSYWRPALVPSCTSCAPSGFECHGRLWDWILLACVLAQFDKIKIDRSFVRNMAESEESAAIVRAVAGLARSLNIVTVVERVETSAQLEMVRSQGCDECQGYLLGRPMPETEVRSILDVHMRTASAA
jgi:hypothetical protein